MEMKQVIVVRKDLGLSAGKLAAQACHASLKAWKKAEKGTRNDWESSGGKKVVLAAEDDEELMELKRNADRAGLVNILVKDAGLTEVEPGTRTALAVGPEEEKKVDKVTGHLPLLK